MQNAKNVWVWVGVVVVVIILIAWASAVLTPRKAVPAGPTAVFAPKGQLVPQFPKELIVDSKAAVAGSYSISYATSTNQYSASYLSSSTVLSLYGKYKTYFSGNGWTMGQWPAPSSAFAALGAVQDGNKVQVSIVAEGKQTQVTVNYVGK